MTIFVAASYSTKVNYDTGEVFPEYKIWLEEILTTLEKQGHTVFCALRADDYKINDADPAGAFKLDMEHIDQCDVMLALVSSQRSVGVQTEIGMAVAKNKKVLIAHLLEDKPEYFYDALVRAGVAYDFVLPLDVDKLAKILEA